MTILLADNDHQVARLAAALVAYLGHPVRRATDGEAALDMMRADDSPDIAILDWALPVVPGPEVCRRLRAEGPTQRFLVLISGDDGADLPRKLHGAGADACVLKPISHDQITALVRQAEAARELLAEVASGPPEPAPAG